METNTYELLRGGIIGPYANNGEARTQDAPTLVPKDGYVILYENERVTAIEQNTDASVTIFVEDNTRTINEPTPFNVQIFREVDNIAFI